MGADLAVGRRGRGARPAIPGALVSYHTAWIRTPWVPVIAVWYKLRKTRHDFDGEIESSMKLYNSRGSNPLVVRMFMAEKGIELPTEEVDIRAGVNRQADYLKLNPAGQCPALELDDGSILAEITVICEYLEDRYPDPPLIGATAEEKAETRMWTRRIDLNICEPMANGFRFSTGLKMFQDRMRCIPQAADDLKAAAQDKLQWLDGLMAGRTFVVGERLTLADILLYGFVDYFAGVDQPIDPNLKNIVAWHERMQARPSARA